jgi:uncharacterized damage-inducible protein DinB
MTPEPVRRYLLQGLAATPIVLERLLREATPADYDRRPDPERFTLREALCHLAEWESLWLERVRRTCTEACPLLPNADPDAAAEAGDYGNADPTEQRRRFREGRAALLAYLESRAPAEWDRTCEHSEWGRMTLSDLVALILGHDGYHLRQTAEWLDAREGLGR